MKNGGDGGGNGGEMDDLLRKVTDNAENTSDSAIANAFCVGNVVKVVSGRG